VLDIVENNGIKTAILDVSFTCHMPIAWRCRISLLFWAPPMKRQANPLTEWEDQLSGSDYMGNWSFDKELKPGDKIIFDDMIHYTTVKTTMFNASIILHWNLEQKNRIQINQRIQLSRL